MHKINCKNCGDELGFRNINRLEDIDFKRLGLYCNTCFHELETKLKESRFVEEYKGNKIYCKDGKYTPYWHSQYYFLSLDDAKKRIDSSHLAYVDLGAMKALNSMLQ